MPRPTCKVSVITKLIFFACGICILTPEMATRQNYRDEPIVNAPESSSEDISTSHFMLRDHDASLFPRRIAASR